MDVISPILEKAGASYVINKLSDVATTYVRDQYYWKTDLEEELRSLRRLLPQIQAVVGFAEHSLSSCESFNPALKEWLLQFRDGIDEAEEVLDDLEYLELEKEANSDKNMLSKMVDASVRAAKRLLKFDDVLGRLRTCVKDLNTSASDVQQFLTLVTQTGGIGTGQMQQEIVPLSNQSRITSSLPVLSFKGREEEKGKIIQYLLGESVEESEIQMSENVHCLPLVAMGGMGKTALAQQVFNHFGNVKKEHFDIKIWVCVSTDLNASRLVKKILEYSTRQSESGPSELIPEKLKEKLHSKRFLLVLDDAWDDKNQTEWEDLCAPLLYGQKGSWIILTTRMESVAKMVSKVIKGTMKPMKLQGLSNDQCRSLLYEHAFAGQDPDKFPLLKEIGKEIVEKLNGVPLLAKSIGGTLNAELAARHWMSISRSELWKTPQDSKYQFIPVLTLSYVMLPPRLKRCFSYCSIFPEDYKFDKQKLVCMWVAAGLIYPERSEEGSDEDIAGRCFDMLCSKSFFDVHTDNHRRSPFTSFYDTAKDIYYTMHDMLNGLARCVSRYECCRIVDVPPSCNLDYNVIRHISISVTGKDAQLHDLAKMVCKFKHLRTLWIYYEGHPQKLDDFIRDACKSPRRIRVLTIQSYPWLVNISDFVKLRFLDISYDSKRLSPLGSLSKSISKLYFLQVLIADEFRNFRILAKAANKLTNLRHLYGAEEDAFSLVAGVRKLISLQELCFFVGTKPGYRIDELMNMNNLHRLQIEQLSNVRSLEEANKVNLVRKSYLTSLQLVWDGASNPDLDQQEVLAALQPPSTIRELCITKYEGGRPAPWMDTSSLSWLESLKLHACTSLEELPPLWKLRCLKFLKLGYMKAIKSLGCHSSDQMDIQFPVLEELEFNEFPLWEEWNGADDYIWFPHLKSFEIDNCPKLKKIPDLPLSIEKLHMRNLGLEVLPRSYKCSNGSRTFGGFQQLMYLKDLTLGGFLPKFLSAEVESQEFLKDKIRQVFDHSASNKAVSILPSSLESLSILSSDISPESLDRCLQGLTSLECLRVSDCQHLVSLANIEYLHNLTALQTLDISYCKEICELESLTALVSLRRLCIAACPKLLATAVSTVQNPATTTEQSATKIKKGTLPSLESIDIDNIFYLPILPISETLKYLKICCDYTYNSLVPFDFNRVPPEIEKCLLQYRESLESLTLGGMPHLQFLPASLESFSSLKYFTISYAPELKSLPRMPASLKQLTIDECSTKLKKRFQKHIGPDWPNINHIPHISIFNKDHDERIATLLKLLFIYYCC